MQVRQLGQQRKRGWQRAAERVCAEAKIRQLAEASDLRRDGARQPLAVQDELVDVVIDASVAVDRAADPVRAADLRGSWQEVLVDGDG